jgi:hypothetical protein
VPSPRHGLGSHENGKTWERKDPKPQAVTASIAAVQEPWRRSLIPPARRTADLRQRLVFAGLSGGNFCVLSTSRKCHDIVLHPCHERSIFRAQGPSRQPEMSGGSLLC